MNLITLFQHDCSHHIVSFMTLKCVIATSIITKGMIKLLEHVSIKNVFNQEFENCNLTFVNNFIISYIYQNRLLQCEHKNINGTLFNFIKRISWRKRNIKQLIQNTLDNNVAYFYYHIFINKDNDSIPMIDIKEIFYVMQIQEKYEFFCKIMEFSGIDDSYLYHPILTIPLIMQNKFIIEKVLNLYNESIYFENYTYNILTYLMIGGNTNINMYECIKRIYPEFLSLVKQQQEKIMAIRIKLYS